MFLNIIAIITWSVICFLIGYVFATNIFIRRIEPLIKDDYCDEEKSNKEKVNEEKSSEEKYAVDWTDGKKS